jgi:hypothetical protein
MLSMQGETSNSFVTKDVKLYFKENEVHYHTFAAFDIKTQEELTQNGNGGLYV